VKSLKHLSGVVGVYNSILSVYYKAQDYPQFFRIYEQLKNGRFSPCYLSLSLSQYYFSYVFTSLSCADGVKADAFTYNMILMTLLRLERNAQAVEVYEQLKSEGLAIDSLLHKTLKLLERQTKAVGERPSEKVSAKVHH
jgi:hypothetical protein